MANTLVEDGFERETIARALTGDSEAGLEALRTCIADLHANQMSERMRFYLAQCLADIVDGMKVERALNIEEERGRGRPKDPFPEWEPPLAAFAALLRRRGRKPSQIAEALDLARQIVCGKGLDPKEARRIQKTYEPMGRIEDRYLLHMCVEGGYGGEIEKYFPLP